MLKGDVKASARLLGISYPLLQTFLTKYKLNHLSRIYRERAKNRFRLPLPAA
jgi:hypothetical protein